MLLLLLGVIPPTVLFLWALAALFAGISLHHENRWLVLCWTIIGASQLVVLFGWVTGKTAAASFMRYAVDHTDRVIDPAIESVLMNLFWGGAIVLTLIICLCTYRKYITPPRKGIGIRTAIIIAEIMLLVAMKANLTNFRRMPDDPLNVRSRSPDQRNEIILVPMNCWIDRNGLILTRHSQEFWWTPVADLGDILTEIDRAWFEWEQNSRRVRLMANGVSSNEQVKLFEYSPENSQQ